MKAKFKNIFGQVFGSMVKWLPTATILVLISYLASVVLVMLAASALTKDHKFELPARQVKSAGSSLDFAQKSNYFEIRTDIKSRNIFNAEREFPDEKVATSEQEVSGSFDDLADCSKVSIPLSIVGILFSTKPDESLTMLKEKDIASPDAYRVNETIIGFEDAYVYAIEQDKVVLNNNGNKECFEFEGIQVYDIETGETKALDVSMNDPGPVVNVIEASVTQEELDKEFGEGGSKLIKAIKLTPYQGEKGETGYRFSAMKGDNFLKRAGFKNGDVVQTVNGKTMSVEDGNLLYDAISNEEEVDVTFINSQGKPGRIKMTITE